SGVVGVTIPRDRGAAIERVAGAKAELRPLANMEAGAADPPTPQFQGPGLNLHRSRVVHARLDGGDAAAGRLAQRAGVFEGAAAPPVEKLVAHDDVGPSVKQAIFLILDHRVAVDEEGTVYMDGPRAHEPALAQRDLAGAVDVQHGAPGDDRRAGTAHGA